MPLRWLSAMAEGTVIVQAACLADDSMTTCSIEGARLLCRNLRAGLWYRIDETNEAWFPVNEFRIQGEQLWVREPGQKEVLAEVLHVVQKVPVTIEGQPQGALDWSEVFLEARPHRNPEAPRILSMGAGRWSRRLSGVSGGKVASEMWVPQWPLSARYAATSGRARWRITEFSHRGKVAAAGEALRLALTRAYDCLIEIWEEESGTFAESVRGQLQAAGARKKAPGPSTPGQRDETGLNLTLDIVALDAPHARTRWSEAAKVDVSSISEAGGLAYSFRVSLTGVSVNASYAFTLSGGARAPVLAYADAAITGADEQTIVLSAASYRRSADACLRIERDSGTIAPFHLVELEMTAGGPGKVVTIFSTRAMANENGEISLGQVPRLRRVALRVRSATFYDEVAESSANGWRELGACASLPDLTVLRVSGMGACPLSVKLEFADPPTAAVSVSFLIVPMARGGGGSADFAVARELTHGAFSTTVTTAGLYMVFVTWGEVFLASEVAYHPRTASMHTIAVANLTRVEIVSTEDVFILPAKLDSATAWTVTNFPDFERAQVFGCLYVRKGRTQKLSLAGIEGLVSDQYGIMADGSFARVSWVRDPSPAVTRFEVILVSCGLGPSLEVTVSEQNVQWLKQRADRVYVVITAVFSESDPGLNATVGLGRRVEIEGPVTTLCGVPPGRYFVTVMLEKAGVPAGMAGDRWSSIVEVPETSIVRLVLPTP